MKKILITGVTGNLGSATCDYFNEQGWHVKGVARNIPGTYRARGVYTPLDLTNWESVEKYVNRLNHGFDIVLMAHGVHRLKRIVDCDRAHWKEIIQGNLGSAFALTRELIRQVHLNQGALIVYCSSIQATQPRAGRSLYAIAKGGLEVLTKATAVELAPDVRTVALRFGQMESLMKGFDFSPEAIAAIDKKIPLPWVGFEDAARFVHHLYQQPSLSGEVIEISSMHKYSVWPK